MNILLNNGVKVEARALLDTGSKFYDKGFKKKYKSFCLIQQLSIPGGIVNNIKQMINIVLEFLNTNNRLKTSYVVLENNCIMCL